MLNLEINPIFGLEYVPTFKNGSGIHIKEKNRGKFTKSAKAAGESVLEHAAHVLSDPNATPLLKKRANFARNAAKWKHQLGGTLKLTPEELNYLAWSKLSPELKRQRNTNIAKSFINRGPSVSNYWNAAKAYFGGFNPTNPNLLTGEPTVLPGMSSSVANVVAKEYLLNSGLKAIKSTDYLIKGIQGTFPKANLSNILNKYNNEILNNGILSEFKNTGRFKNLMNEILLEIEKVYGRLGSEAFNVIKTNPEGLPYRLGLEWILKYNLKKGGKTHKPFGHRSILDNGWLSTKLLKNKKNVYGK